MAESVTGVGGDMSDPKNAGDPELLLDDEAKEQEKLKVKIELAVSAGNTIHDLLQHFPDQEEIETVRERWGNLCLPVYRFINKIKPPEKTESYLRELIQVGGELRNIIGSFPKEYEDGMYGVAKSRWDEVMISLQPGVAEAVEASSAEVKSYIIESKIDFAIDALNLLMRVARDLPTQGNRELAEAVFASDSLRWKMIDYRNKAPKQMERILKMYVSAGNNLYTVLEDYESNKTVFAARFNWELALKAVA